jgi:hypothetical protein
LFQLATEEHEAKRWAPKVDESTTTEDN